MSAAGWAALAGCSGATMLAGRILHRTLFALSPVLATIALPVMIVVGALLTLRLVVVKGRAAR